MGRRHQHTRHWHHRNITAKDCGRIAQTRKYCQMCASSPTRFLCKFENSCDFQTPSVATHVRSGKMDHHCTMTQKCSDVFAPCRVLHIVGFDGMSGLEVQRCARDASRVNRWAGLTTHKHWTREITSSTNRVQRVRSLTPAMSALALQVLKHAQQCHW